MRRYALLLGIVSSVAVIGAVAGLAWLGVRTGQVHCVVENEASEKIDVTVGIYEGEYSAADLSPGEWFSFEFKPGKDSHYEVEVIFQSGRSYNQDVGYITSGLSIRHRIIIGDETATITAIAD